MYLLLHNNTIPSLELRIGLNVNFMLHADFLSEDLITAIFHRQSVNLNLH